MRTLNGGEEFESRGGEPNPEELINRLIREADRTTRVIAAAPFSGELAATQVMFSPHFANFN